MSASAQGCGCSTGAGRPYHEGPCVTSRTASERHGRQRYSIRSTSNIPTIAGSAAAQLTRPLVPVDSRPMRGQRPRGTGMATNAGQSHLGGASQRRSRPLEGCGDALGSAGRVSNQRGAARWPGPTHEGSHRKERQPQTAETSARFRKGIMRRPVRWSELGVVAQAALRARRGS